jgi:serine/threonine protein phosphatase 1
MTLYAIGDIHGRLDLLEAALERIAADQARHGTGVVVMLGDLVDRGPDSRGVIDLLMRGLAAGERWVVLKGNHDRMFAGFLADPQAQDQGLDPRFSWLYPRIGGGATLASYGVRQPADRPVRHIHAEALEAVPPAHRAFLQALPTLYRVPGLILVHAGLRPGLAPEAQAETDLLWIRAPFLQSPDWHGALVVHGHTVVETPEHHGNRVAIDTGAGYGRPLTAIAIDGDGVHVLEPAGRVPLRPRAPAEGDDPPG